MSVKRYLLSLLILVAILLSFVTPLPSIGYSKVAAANNSFEPTEAPWHWQMVSDKYSVRVKEAFNIGQIVEFAKHSESIQFQPMALEWTNDLDQVQQISMPQSITPSVTNPNNYGTIRWNDAYGAGIDFQWQCIEDRLFKILEIESFDKLSIPEQYIIDGGNPALKLNFIFDPSPNLEIFVDGVAWDKKTTTTTTNKILFQKNTGEKLWTLEPVLLWDNQLNENHSAATLEKRGNKLYISAKVPYIWLETAAYPVFFDYTIEVFPEIYRYFHADAWNGDKKWLLDMPDGGSYSESSVSLENEGDYLIQGFQSEPLDFDELSAGEWGFYLWGKRDSGSAEVRLFAKVRKNNSTGELLATTDFTDELDTTTQEYNCVTNFPTTSWAPNDRLWVGVYAHITEGQSNKWAYFQYDHDSRLSRVVDPDIDVGAAAVDRALNVGRSYTYVTLDNPANDTGTLTNVEIWCEVDLHNTVVGTFFHVSGTTYQCRDSEVIGDVTSGSKQTFAVSINVTSGDYIGIYYTGLPNEGAMERDDSGYAGVYRVAGEYIDPGDSASYTLLAGDALSLYATGTTGGAAAPSIDTLAASSVEETTATVSGNITATGGDNVTERGFDWDTDSGVPYTDNWTEVGNWGVGTFSHGLTSLTKGELYYFRAKGQNSVNWTYGSELTFLTKPDPATSFGSTDNGTTWISVNWTNGTGMDYMEVRYDTGSAPADNVSGSLGYWGSGTTANVTGLSANTTYYFTAFTHATEGGLWSTSDNSPTCQDTTDAVAANPPSVTTNAATSVEETTATLNGNITDIGSDNVTERGFDWDTDSGVPYTDNWTEAGDFPTGAFSHGITGLTKGELYYFRAKAQNSVNWTYGSELTFLTKPDGPTGGVATANGTTWISVNWTNGDGFDYAQVRYQTGSYPADNTTGTAAYWDTGTSVNITGLSPGTTYYIRVWNHATEGGLWQTADTTADMTEDTEGLPPPPAAISPSSTSAWPLSPPGLELEFILLTCMVAGLAFWKKHPFLYIMACLAVANFTFTVYDTFNIPAGIVIALGLGTVSVFCFYASLMHLIGRWE